MTRSSLVTGLVFCAFWAFQMGVPGNSAFGQAADPFADLTLTIASSPSFTASRPAASRTRTFLKKELISQFSWEDGSRTPYSRQSIGGELLQRFSDDRRTWGSFNLQGRLVHRNAFRPVLNDMEGESRSNWFAEYHNVYFDLFNAIDPFLSPEARRDNLGRYHFRIGRFYLPSGINLQTDTHGTVLQLSNDRNFGFERDWYAGFWGGLSPHVSYDLYAMAGSGYDLRLEGQKGLLGLRLSLSSRSLFERGLEGGLSLLTGERLSSHALMRSPSVAAQADRGRFIETRRYGADIRQTRPVSGGTLISTGEWSTGRDESDNVFTQLYQFEFLRRDRKLGWALQYRRFFQDIGSDPMMPEMTVPGKTDASLAGEVTWYFRNDVGNSNLHWIKLNIERQLERQSGRAAVLTTLNYYRYW